MSGSCNSPRKSVETRAQRPQTKEARLSIPTLPCPTLPARRLRPPASSFYLSRSNNRPIKKQAQQRQCPFVNAGSFDSRGVGQVHIV